MSGTSTKTRKAADPSKPRKPQGPRTMYIVFPEGTSQEVLDVVKSATITFNGRMFIQGIQGANVKPFVVRQIDVAAKDVASEAGQ